MHAEEERILASLGYAGVSVVAPKATPNGRI
jgi:hypothetical protein